MSENKKSPLGIVLIILGLVGAVILYGFTQRTNDAVSEATSENQNKPLTTAAYDASQSATSKIELDIQSLGTPRILGDINAPIKISEHSSFTCGGCAAFHRGNFKQIKKDYVDTGKAYIVYDDFPRNQQDIKIGAIARCVPDESYFNFVQVIFETQRDWSALGDKYLSNIKNTAVFSGADENKINQCAEATELHEVLAERRDNANKTHNVRSTPSLVINDKVVISGLSKYKDIKGALDSALAKTQQ